MLSLLDIFFTLLHLIIIVFNLLGWIWKPTRRLHFIVVLLTAFSWFILGIWFGLGYCPLTDWHWSIKEQLGETNLPGSFVKYFADRVLQTNIEADTIDLITGAAFILASILSVCFNFIWKKKAVTHL